MNDPTHVAFDRCSFDLEAVRIVTAMATSMTRVVCIAKVLIDNGRSIDLTGLDRGVGLLCAKSLDLPPEAGRSVLPSLAALLDDVERLTNALQGGNSHCSPPLGKAAAGGTTRG